MRSVKSGAAAISTRPARRSGRARAASSDSQPPMLDPTSTSLPVGELVEHGERIVEPAADRAVLEAARRLAMTEIVEAHEGAAGPLGPGLERHRLGAGHVGAEAAQERHRRRATRCRLHRRRCCRQDAAVFALYRRWLIPCYLPHPSTFRQADVSAAPTLLQIVPTLAGGGLARATLDAAQAVIAAGGPAIVASPGGAMVPDLLRLRATHLELPDGGHRAVGPAHAARQARLEPQRGARLADPGALAQHRLGGARAGAAARASSGSPPCTRPSSPAASPSASSSAARRAPMR